MINPQLVSYIEQQLANKTPIDDIKLTLQTKGGWASSDIDNAFNNLNKPKEKSFKVNNYIALIFVVLFIFTSINDNEQVANILFFVMLILGGVAGASFYSRLNKLAKNNGSSLIVKGFLNMVGFFGCVIIFMMSLGAGLGGMLKHVHGD